MRDVNCNHLLYFWKVAREGSLQRASAALGLSPSTVSAQIRDLERSLGGELFERRGRGMVITEFGQAVFPYADEIAGLAREVRQAARDRPRGRPARVAVGIASGVHKILVPLFLTPLLEAPEKVRLVCREDRAERLQAELAAQALDLVLADRPADPTVRVTAYSHLLGESGTTLFASPPLAERFRRGFPGSLDGAPLLLPTPTAAVRGEFDRWFAARGIRPRIAGEFEDVALLKTFGEKGMGIITAPTSIEGDVRRRYTVQPIGRVPEVRERFYAITVERRIRNPLVSKVTERARERLRG